MAVAELMRDAVSLQVLKASGVYEPFSEEKVGSSLKRVGVEESLQNQILDNLKTELYDGISTHEIYQKVSELLKKFESPSSSKYRLRRAIMELGPEGHYFERFVAGLLKNEGYEVRVGQIVRGKCINHEVDITALREKEHYMVECKFHNQQGIKTDVKVALYTYARFLDVCDSWVELAGHKDKFHQAWLVTNTKLTTEVISYAACVGLKVISWEYPDNGNLRILIEKSGLYPITSLQSLSLMEKQVLLSQGIIFYNDLVGEKGESLDPSVRKKAEDELFNI